MHPFKARPLAVLVLAGGAVYCAQARSAPVDSRAMVAALSAAPAACASGGRVDGAVLSNIVVPSPR